MLSQFEGGLSTRAMLPRLRLGCSSKVQRAMTDSDMRKLNGTQERLAFTAASADPRQTQLLLLCHRNCQVKVCGLIEASKQSKSNSFLKGKKKVVQV